jgi:formiminoglutamase
VIGGSNDQSYPNASGLMQALGPRKPIGVVNIDAHLDVRPLKNGKVHSGSPFRLLLQDTRFNPDPYTEPPSSSSSSSSSSSPSKKRKRRGSTSRYVPFVEFAAQGSQCSYDHSMFVKNNGGQIHWLLKDLRGDGSEQFFSPELLSGSVVTERFLDVLDELATAQMPKGKRRALFCSFDLDAVTGADAPGVSCPGTVGLSAEEAFGICYSAGSQAEVQLMDLSEFNPAVDDYRTGRLVANMFYHFLLGVADRRRGGKRSSSFRVTPKSARKKVVLSPSPGAKRVKR